MIEIESLVFLYPRSPFRLSVEQLCVEQGSTVGIVGPSGSGKTTLLNLIAGVLAPTSGRITACGECITELGPAARRGFRVRRIGLVFQEFELIEHLSVADNILLPCRLTSAVSIDDAIRERVGNLANEMAIGDKLARYPRQLSQGERQRVAVCRALLLQPPLLLCDEPTGNLDPVNKSQVLDVLFAYVRRNQTTMVAVTHDHQILDRFDQTIDFAQFHAKGKVRV